MFNAARTQKIAGLLLLNDLAGAADEIDLLADELRGLAARLRAQADNPTRDTGGMGERVQIDVVGPDGEIKKSVDTQRGEP